MQAENRLNSRPYVTPRIFLINVSTEKLVYFLAQNSKAFGRVYNQRVGGKLQGRTERRLTCAVAIDSFL
jgi:hypothetical protein